jgi:hypothetical protein
MKKIKIIALIILSLIIIEVLTTVVINKVLESQWERKTESQYELIRKTVDENSEYYTDFSKDFIRVIKAKVNVENIVYRNTFQIFQTENEMRIPLNKNLIAGWKYVEYEPIDGDYMWYVRLESLYHVGKFEYWFGYSHIYLVEYAIIYVPDEYMTDTNMKAILGGNYESHYRKNNLFVVQRLENRYPT